MPRRWGLGSYTMPYDKVRYDISVGQMGSGLLTVSLPVRHFLAKSVGGVPERDISFLTWYMDKNRPLPLGRAFDPYRKRDYERRKAEGFPEPLYPSHIVTEEYKPELTIEANKGKLVNIETIGREMGSEWYSPYKHKNWIVVRYIKDQHNISPLQHELIRYEFENGHVIYARTTETGEVARPPETEKFQESLIVGAALKVEKSYSNKGRSVADRWEDRNL